MPDNHKTYWQLTPRGRLTRAAELGISPGYWALLEQLRNWRSVDDDAPNPFADASTVASRFPTEPRFTDALLPAVFFGQERLAQVIVLRYGLDGHPQRIFKDIAKALEISAVRAQELHNKAIAALGKIYISAILDHPTVDAAVIDRALVVTKGWPSPAAIVARCEALLAHLDGSAPRPPGAPVLEPSDPAAAALRWILSRSRPAPSPR